MFAICSAPGQEVRPIHATSRPVTRLEAIAPGTRIVEAAPPGWTHLVLLSQPTLPPAERSKVGAMIADLATKFSTVTAARVTRNGATQRFVLQAVGHGIVARVATTRMVVTTDSQKALGAGLSLPARILLSELEAKQAAIRLVAVWEAGAVVDTPAVMPGNDRHEDAVIRYWYLLDERTGRLDTWAMRLNLDPAGRITALGSPIHRLVPSLVDEAPLRVDAREFTWGVPSPLAFAIDGIPDGERVGGLNRDDTTRIARSHFAIDDIQHLTQTFLGNAHE
ncbi:MAG TPA: hypothetical protein VIY86_10550 [Pirellulaceae bacterium]